MAPTSTIVLVVVVLGLAGVDQARGNEPKVCQRPGDLVFVLDESGSIWGPDFQRQLSFTEHIADEFQIGPNHTRIGMMTFGSDTRIIFHLDQYDNRDAIKNEIKAISQKRGGTRTDIALEQMRVEMFSRQHTRPNAAAVAIVITDGESEYPDLTAEQAKLAHEAGIQVLAIGVGPSFVKDELERIASSLDLVYAVDNYAALTSLQKSFAVRTCEVFTPPPPTTTTTTPAPRPMMSGCAGYKTMDVLWATSGHANAADTDAALQLITEVAQSVEFGPDGVQFGLTPRVCDVTNPAIRLKDHDTKEGLELALNGRRLVRVANTEHHLEYMRAQGFSASSGGRAEAVKFGVLLVDGQSANVEAIKSQAQRTKRAGVRLIVVGIGNNVDEAELKAIASTNRDVLTVGSYSELASLKNAIIQRLCSGIVATLKRSLWEFLEHQQ